MTAPVSFFIFAVLFATARRGSSIQCQTCFYLNGTCVEPVEPCEPVFDACISVVIEAKSSVWKVRSTNNQCTTRKKCTPGPIFRDLENGYQEVGNSICCTTDGCNVATPAIPKRDEVLNGLRCPFCNAEGFDTCKEEVISCKGSATHCFTRRAGDKTVTTINDVTTTTYEITQKGCATESFCANAADAGLIFSGNITLWGAPEVICRAAYSGGTNIGSDSTMLYLHILAGLLMTKSFHHCFF
ncbi:phospholipase A2 inhibitor and Ly6/PLAUR domain-containing protein-like [Eublepharis macularius]|uniref:Phospholipase A2 inhibitor and Ly6/PLAUR domain-containing protein-like n=1 Tax=Eublepharis macularius TaxID=481883 RepID=A0AA97KF04_EUBMA|nr:phospholipase A2 inhibitor and Ly6/PLAUR domain-containing protein-like [Eublepharis macularius]